MASCLAARHVLVSTSRDSSIAQSLIFIFPGHCTPVESVEKGWFFAPSGLDAHVQIQVDFHPEERLHFLPGQRADALQGSPLGADDDCLLPGTLDPDCGVDAREARRL